MWLVPVTFAIAFATVAGLYWLLVLRPEAADRAKLTARLQSGSPSLTRPRHDSLIKEERRLSDIPLLERVLERAGTASGSIQTLLDSADVDMTVGRFMLASALLGLLAYGLVAVTLRQYGIALLVSLIAAALPYLVVRRKRTVRIRKFEEQFPEAIDLIARAMRAGHGLTAGLGMVADELGAPAGREFRLLYDWQNFGMSLSDALQKFATRIPLLDAKFFVTSVLTQRESGGNLSEVLDNLAKVIRDRFRVKRQIRVISAHGRMTGAVLCGLPPSLACYFLVTQPQYLHELTSNPVGVQMIVGALILQVIGMLIIRKITNIEY